MQQLIVIFHMLLCVILVGLILIQKGKGAGMGSAFGSGASQTVFGSKGSVGFLMKITIVIAALFFTTSIALTYIAAKASKHKSTSQGFLGQVESISKEAKNVNKNTSTLPAKKKTR